MNMHCANVKYLINVWWCESLCDSASVRTRREKKSWKRKYYRRLIHCLYHSFPCPSLTHRQWQTYFMSHDWSRLAILPFQSLVFNVNTHPTPTTLASRKTLSFHLVWPPPSPSSCLPSLPPPSVFISSSPSPASHPLSLSLSPHPSPPLLRVSGRLFFLCLLLMKGRTKLPSLCPCVVGKITSAFVSSFLLPSLICCLCFAC